MKLENPNRIQIMDPTGDTGGPGKKNAPLIADVKGTNVGFRVQWPSFDIFMNRMEELLVKDYGVSKTHYMFTGSDGTAAGKVTIRGRADAISWAKAYDDLAAKISWGIFGLAA